MGGCSRSSIGGSGEGGVPSIPFDDITAVAVQESETYITCHAQNMGRVGCSPKLFVRDFFHPLDEKSGQLVVPAVCRDGSSMLCFVLTCTWGAHTVTASSPLHRNYLRFRVIIEALVSFSRGVGCLEHDGGAILAKRGRGWGRRGGVLLPCIAVRGGGGWG